MLEPPWEPIGMHGNPWETLGYAWEPIGTHEGQYEAMGNLWETMEKEVSI